MAVDRVCGRVSRRHRRRQRHAACRVGRALTRPPHLPLCHDDARSVDPSRAASALRYIENIRISTDILRRVFRILTEPVPYTSIYVQKSTE